MTSGSSSTSPAIPDELKQLYMQAAASMQRGMSDMPMSDFYEMPTQQFTGLTGSEQRAQAASENLYGQSPALNEAYSIASQLAQNQGAWRGADLSSIGATPPSARGGAVPTKAPPVYPGRG